MLLTIDNFKINVNPEKIPLTDTGRPGSILDIALGNNIRLNHTCGGVCSCTTCHVFVKEGLESCSKPSQAELDRLKEVYGLRPNSRLACQCIPSGTEDIVVEIP